MSQITDLSPYRQHVDQFDMSDEQKLELVNLMQMVAEQILDQQFQLNQPNVNAFNSEDSLEIQCTNGNVEVE